MSDSIKVEIDQAAIQQLQQRLSALSPRILAAVYKALQPLVYQSLRSAIPKYFAGSGGPESALLASRSGKLMNSVLQSIEARIDGEKMVVSIGSDVRYAAIHEYGGFAGRKPPFKKKDAKRPYLRPRPYLHPAMNDLQQALPDLLEQAIQQAQVAP
jgi:phage gpG-like protein